MLYRNDEENYRKLVLRNMMEMTIVDQRIQNDRPVRSYGP